MKMTNKSHQQQIVPPPPPLFSKEWQDIIPPPPIEEIPPPPPIEEIPPPPPIEEIPPPPPIEEIPPPPPIEEIPPPQKSVSQTWNNNPWNNPWKTDSVSSSIVLLADIQASQEVESKRLREEQARLREELAAKEEEELAIKRKHAEEYQLRQQERAREINEMMRELVCDQPYQCDSDFFGKLRARSTLDLGHKTSSKMIDIHKELTHNILGPLLIENKYNPMQIWNYSILTKYHDEAYSIYRSLGGNI
jgi:hypothetical protein